MQLTNVNGEKHVLEDLLGERGTILYFSGTWVSSSSTLEYLNEQNADYKKNGIQVYFIDLSNGDEKARDFINEHNVTLDYFVDGKQLAEKYDVLTLPTTVFINPYGQTEVSYASEIESEIIESIIHKWLDNEVSGNSQISRDVLADGDIAISKDITTFYESMINGQYDMVYDFLRVPFLPTKEEYISYKENEPEKLVGYEILEDLTKEVKEKEGKVILVRKTYIDQNENEFIVEVVDEFRKDSATGIWKYTGQYYENLKTIRLGSLLESSSGDYDPSFYFSLLGKSRDMIIHILGEPEVNYEAEYESDQLSYLQYPEVFLGLTPDFQVASVALNTIKGDASIDDIINRLGDPDYEDYDGENLEGSTYIGYEYSDNVIEFHFSSENNVVTSIVMR
nr:TlpA disulfide reductase family protein [Sporosarcina sp. ACRSL]